MTKTVHHACTMCYNVCKRKFSSKGSSSMYLKLRNMRLRRRLTTGDMAEKLNISKPFYCQIETGRRRLSYDMAVRIAAIFRAKPDTIFYQDHINNQDNSSAIEE